MLESWGLCREAGYFSVSGKIDSPLRQWISGGFT